MLDIGKEESRGGRQRTFSREFVLYFFIHFQVTIFSLYKMKKHHKIIPPHKRLIVRKVLILRRMRCLVKILQCPFKSAVPGSVPFTVCVLKANDR